MSFSRRSVAAVGIAVALGSVGSVGLANAAASPRHGAARARAVSTSSSSFSAYWSGTDGYITTSFPASVAQTAAQTPSEIPTITVDLQGLLARAQAGVDVNLPGVIGAPQDVTAIQDALTDVAGQSSTSQGTATAEDTESPADFPTEGGALEPHYRTWAWGTDGQGGTLVLGRTICNNDGCYTSDEVTGTAVVDPGAVASRFTGTTSYIINSGGFANIHFQGYVMCYDSREECGDSNSSDNPNQSRPWTVYSDVHLNGDHGSWAIKLWARETGSSGYDGKGEKTDIAYCNKTNAVCTF